MRRLFLSISLLLASLGVLVVGFSGQAAAFDPFRTNNDPTVCTQTNPDGNQSPVCEPDGSNNPLTGPNGIINRIANIFALLSGVAAVVVIIVGGFEYVRSGGESAKVNKAKNTILFAIIGLVVIVVARSLVIFTVSRL